MIHRVIILCAVTALALAAGSAGRRLEADLVLVGGRVWTGNPAAPWAEAVAVQRDRILAVGTRREIEPFRGPRTRALSGPFILPGFIDAHTHFDRAGALILGVNLLDVADRGGLVQRVRGARDRLPKDAWIVGGDWGAYEAWGMGTTGREETQAARRREPVARREEFRPHREMIDSITPANPVLLSRWDRSLYLANARALGAAGATCAWPGVECENGQPTGRLTPAAAERIRAVIPPKSFEQRLAEARAALAQLRENGVTTIHDNTPPYQFAVYEEIRRRGELTVRVYARPTLDKWDELRAVGIGRGFGDDWIKIGGLKGFVDGIMGNRTARFYEPYLTRGERGERGEQAARGAWRDMFANPAGNMERLLLGADSAGHWAQVHAIGDEAIDTLLDLYERVIEVNGPKERRFRVIHAQVLRGPEVAERMAQLGVIAEVQPYHAIDDMRWMEERIGARARWAYAFKTMHDAGVLLSFGSDWPGTNASWYPASPILGIYAAVTRQTLGGKPDRGWFPEERLDVQTALRAYTVNNAYAAGEEALKGSIEPGKLADLVILDADLFTIAAERLKDVRVLYTVVGGRIVYAR